MLHGEGATNIWGPENPLPDTVNNNFLTFYLKLLTWLPNHQLSQNNFFTVDIKLLL